MHEDIDRFSSLCGFFRLNSTTKVCDGPVMSPTWERAYAKWRERPAVLTSYEEHSGQKVAAD